MQKECHDEVIIYYCDHCDGVFIDESSMIKHMIFKYEVARF